MSSPPSCERKGPGASESLSHCQTGMSLEFGERMNVVVCLKQVPGTTQVKIDPETNTLVRQGIKNIVNPFDTYALEEGVRLKEKHGGKVTVITMGPPQAEEALREAISLGAEQAVLLCDSHFP